MRLCGMGTRLFSIDLRFLDRLRGGCGFSCHDDITRGGARLVFGQLGVVVEHFLILIRVTITNESEGIRSVLLSDVLCVCEYTCIVCICEYTCTVCTCTCQYIHVHVIYIVA